MACDLEQPMGFRRPGVDRQPSHAVTNIAAGGRNHAATEFSNDLTVVGVLHRDRLDCMTRAETDRWRSNSLVSRRANDEKIADPAIGRLAARRSIVAPRGGVRFPRQGGDRVAWQAEEITAGFQQWAAKFVTYQRDWRAQLGQDLGQKQRPGRAIGFCGGSRPMRQCKNRSPMWIGAPLRFWKSAPIVASWSAVDAFRRRRLEPCDATAGQITLDDVSQSDRRTVRRSQDETIFGWSESSRKTHRLSWTGHPCIIVSGLPLTSAGLTIEMVSEIVKNVTGSWAIDLDRHKPFYSIDLRIGFGSTAKPENWQAVRLCPVSIGL